ncbi:hypothetical protein ABT364_18880 [Massilia sp. SR12]
MSAENASVGVLAMLLERDLTILHGPMMTGEPLRRALGYPSLAAFRQALARKTLPVPIFDIEKRRGKFALTKDVATWVAQQRTRARNCNSSKQTTQENA